MFIGMSRRMATNPECISALMARASARIFRSDGHKEGEISARYSPIARESQTTVSPSTRQGTLPLGEYFKISAFAPTPLR